MIDKSFSDDPIVWLWPLLIGNVRVFEFYDQIAHTDF